MIKRFFLMLCLTIAISFAEEDHFSITSVYVVPVESGHFDVSVKSNIVLTEEQERLLDSGIPLTYVYNLKVQEKKSWSFITSYNAYFSYRFTLRYNMLTQQYVVTTNDSKHYENFPTLSLALSYIAEPNNLPLYIVDKKEDKQYEGGIRLKLDIESLPIPIKIPAYLSSAWKLTSGWKYWDL